MMERLLRNNTVVKVIAFFLALVFWAYVTGDVKENQQIYSNVPLQYVNLHENLQVINVPPNVDVVLGSTNRELLDQITPQTLRAYLDLANLAAGQHRLTPSAQLPRGVRVISFNPQQVLVELEAIESIQMPVSFDVLGSPAAGFVLGESRLNPDSVFVRGPRSKLNVVSKVRAILNIDGADRDRTQMILAQPIDAAGRVVEGVRVHPNMVEVVIPLSRPRKTVPVRVPVNGEPASGYQVKEIRITPATVVIQGQESDIKAVSEIVTAPVTINGATGTVTAAVAYTAVANVEVLHTGTIQVEIIIAPR